jgi:hypothetical protein
VTTKDDAGIDEIAAKILAAIKRGKADFTLCRTNTPGQMEFGLIAGAKRAHRVPGGFLVTLQLDREKLENLRDTCNELLGEGVELWRNPS